MRSSNSAGRETIEAMVLGIVSLDWLDTKRSG